MATFNKTLSLYIPRVLDIWASVEAISPIFKQLDIGDISRIDFVEKQSDNGIVYYQAFIYFSEWYDTNSARNLQKRIMNYDEDPDNFSAARIVYDDPWYWLLFANKKPVTEVERDLRQRLQNAEQSQRNAYQLITQLDMQCQNNAYWASCALTHANSLQTNVDFLMTHLGLLNQQVPLPPTSPLARMSNTAFGGCVVSDDDQSCDYDDQSCDYDEESREEVINLSGGKVKIGESVNTNALDARFNEHKSNKLPSYSSAREDFQCIYPEPLIYYNSRANVDMDDGGSDREELQSIYPEPLIYYNSHANADLGEMDEMDEMDEDEGLMPFVHTQDMQQRSRAFTEEEELETRRRQKIRIEPQNCELTQRVIENPITF
jgi:hypothetical protein